MEMSKEYEILNTLNSKIFETETYILRKIIRIFINSDGKEKKRPMYQVVKIKNGEEVIKHENANYDYAINYFNICINIRS